MNINHKTDQEIRLQGFRALRNELGITDFIRFIQQFEQGSGDYTKERKQWQQNYTVDNVLQMMKEQGYIK